MTNLSIVFPAYNEENNINKTLTDFSNTFPEAELIVACNGCTDQTVDMIPDYPNIRKIIFPKKNKGYSVIESLKHAKGDIVGFVDSDGSFLADDIKSMINQLENTDVVIASKWKNQNFSEVKSSFTRKVTSKSWNKLTNSMFRLGLKDTQAGAKFFKKNVFEEIDKNFITSGFGFDVELLYRIKKKGFDITEFFVPLTDITSTNHNLFKQVPKMFFSLLNLRLKTIFRKKKHNI